MEPRWANAGAYSASKATIRQKAASLYVGHGGVPTPLGIERSYNLVTIAFNSLSLQPQMPWHGTVMIPPAPPGRLHEPVTKAAGAKPAAFGQM